MRRSFRRAGSFRGEAQVTTWLHRITVNASLDRLRRVRPTSDIADHDPVEPRDRHHSVDVRYTLPDGRPMVAENLPVEPQDG